MKELLTLNNSLMKNSIHFSLILAPAEERFGYFMQDSATPHRANETIGALRGVFGELMGRMELLKRACGPQDPQI
jgi:hypothetical protein